MRLAVIVVSIVALLFAASGAIIAQRKHATAQHNGAFVRVLPNGDVAPVVAQAPEAQEQPAAVQVPLVPTNEIETYLFAAADEFGVDRALALAMMGQESGGNPNAVSYVGATGVLQVMPATAASIANDLGVASYDLTNPQMNTRFGMYYFSQKLQRYGSVEWALAAYNCGPGCVDAFLLHHPEAQTMDWQSILSRWGVELPSETQGYVTNILAMYERNTSNTQVQQIAYTIGASAIHAPPLVLSGCLGTNVRAAMDSSPGLHSITIPSGGDWSFNEHWIIAGVVMCGVVGGGVCNQASRYSYVARNLGLQVSSQYHNYIYDSAVPQEDNLAIWSSGGRGGQDLIIRNTTNQTVHIEASIDGDVLNVQGWLE